MKFLYNGAAGISMGQMVYGNILNRKIEFYLNKAFKSSVGFLAKSPKILSKTSVKFFKSSFFLISNA